MNRAYADGSHDLEARRYKNSSGVEIITARESKPAAASPDHLVPLKSPSENQTQVRAGSVVSAQDQAKRQHDRLAILNDELAAEGSLLLTKRKALASPRSSVDLTAEQISDLQKQVARHEENLRALSREIAKEAPAKPIS